MKLLLCFLVVVVSAHCYTSPVRSIGTIEDNVRRLIVKEGYHAQVYTVQTEDGYQLDMVRIPHPRQVVTQDDLSRVSVRDDDSQENQQRPAVLLMPGMMSTFEDFVIGGPSESLAFRLADAGYDVYMGNVRGSFYGQKHATLNPERDNIFWAHCWHDIGVKDLPAIIDKVIAISGQEKIDYIGHMGGSTIFYVMASIKPEYNDKIKSMISLGPIAYMKHTKNEFLKQLDSKIVDQEINILQNTQMKSSDVWRSGWMTKYVGVNSYGWNSDILSDIEEKCKRDGYDDAVCSNIYFIVGGYNSENYNMTTIRRMAPRVPSPVSSRQVLHYVQLMNSGRFQWYNETFDRHQQSGRQYDLSKVTTPVIIFYTPDDVWSQEEDVQHLIQDLPNVVHSERIAGLTNNMDFLFHERLGNHLHGTVLQMLKQREQMSGQRIHMGRML